MIKTVSRTESIYNTTFLFSIPENKKYRFSIDSLLLLFPINSNKNNIIFEFGGGTGICSILFHYLYPYKKIFVIEKMREFFEIIKYNINANKLKKIIPVELDISEIDKKFKPDLADIIISNPPYLNIKNNRPSSDPIRTAMFFYQPDQLDIFIQKIKYLLKPSGRCYIIFLYSEKETLHNLINNNDLFISKTTNLYIQNSPKLVIYTITKKGIKKAPTANFFLSEEIMHSPEKLYSLQN